MGEDGSGGGGRRKIFIFTNAFETMTAAIFEIEIGIGGGMLTSVEAPADDIIIQPIAAFFEQRPLVPKIASVGAAFVKNCSELYLFSDETEKDLVNTDIFDNPIPYRILPIKFHLINKTQDHIPNFSLARKNIPCVAALGNHVYVLSLRKFSLDILPEPCFESLNPNNEWTSLPCSPWEDKLSHRLTGHAVLEDKFILVFIRPLESCDLFIYSYNIQTGKWKTVDTPTGSSYIIGEAVVLNNNIYSYRSQYPGQLVVYSYTNVSEETGLSKNDILLDSPRIVQGFEMDKEFDFEKCTTFNQCVKSSALGKVKDGILCVIQSMYEEWFLSVLHICVSIIQLEGTDRCIVLKSFMCHLGVGLQKNYPRIKSCIVLDPNETSESSEQGSSFSG